MKWNTPKHFPAAKEARYVLNGRALINFRRAELRRFAQRLGVPVEGKDKVELVNGIEGQLMVQGVPPGDITQMFSDSPRRSTSKRTEVLDDEEREALEQEVREASGVPDPESVGVDLGVEHKGDFDPFTEAPEVGPKEKG